MLSALISQKDFSNWIKIRSLPINGLQLSIQPRDASSLVERRVRDPPNALSFGKAVKYSLSVRHFGAVLQNLHSLNRYEAAGHHLIENRKECLTRTSMGTSCRNVRLAGTAPESCM